MKRLILSVLSLLSAFSIMAQNYPFRDESLTREQRIDDLMGRLTLEEKVSMMMHDFKGVDRLGIPAYNWWNEALHGVARAGLATVFPQPIGLAATFDPAEQYNTYSMVSDEARAKYNKAVSEGNRNQYYGLTFWTPNINIFRDPRWGRGQETYGEDPYLTSVMGCATVKGLQGNDQNYYKTHACAKHFAVHSGPETLRHKFNVSVSMSDLWETYLYAFHSLITEAGVREVMCAYNSLDGQPCCGNDKLLSGILRNQWKFTGLLVSDCGAIDDFYNKGAHETYPNAQKASAAAVRAGTDLECGGSYGSLTEGVKNGTISEAELDNSVRRILRSRFELGMFDKPSSVPWSSIPYSEVDSKEHRAQALKMACESIVLLKNVNGILPLKAANLHKIAVVGPNAVDSVMMWGNYNGIPSKTVTILQGIRNAFPSCDIKYERGCDLANPVESEEEIAKATKAASSVASSLSDADVIIFVGGLSSKLEGEEGEQFEARKEGFSGGDREVIELPKSQSRMLKALHSTGKPVVFVMCTGSAIGLAKDEENYDALICAWYSGEEGGTAVANVLSGKYNPSGRLPITFYKSTSQLPSFVDYSMKGRTYRYMTEKPLYPFGFGLSYTNFKYSAPKLMSSGNKVASRGKALKTKLGQDVKVLVNVKNEGIFDGDEVVQVYVKRLATNSPVKALKGFQRISLKAGESKLVEISLPASSFDYYDSEVGALSEAKGNYRILIGPSSSDDVLSSLPLVIK